MAERDLVVPSVAQPGRTTTPRKQKLSDLAIFSGEPAFRHERPVGLPNIGNLDHLLKRIETIVRTKRLTNNGPFVQELENRVANIVGVRHCIAVANATAGLELLIRATQLTGEVLMPSFTFVAAAHALYLQGITPVFCDIDPKTHNIDIADLTKKITPKTTGILAVHLWGRPADIAGLTSVAEKHSLKLLFDAAHAFGCSFNGTMIGCFGLGEVFSFHGTKFINSFEGGIVSTNDDNLANRVRLMRNFGFADYDQVVSIGVNAKMSEASAAMGLTSLESMGRFLQSNREHHQQYLNELAGVRGISVCTYNASNQNNFHYLILEVDESQFRVGRDRLKDILWAENILARRYFYPGCHRMEPYRSLPQNSGLRLVKTDQVAHRVLALPTGNAITASDIATICCIIKLIAANPVAVRDRGSEALKSEWTSA